MLLDSQNLFSDAQKITTASIDSENIVKFGKGDISFLPLLIQVVEDFSNLDSLSVKVITSKTEAFDSPVELASTTLALEDLKAGKRFPIAQMPKGNLGYVKLSYVAQGASETTGKITAGIISELDLSPDMFVSKMSSIPTDTPTTTPTEAPEPTVEPTTAPTQTPTEEPTQEPTEEPTTTPTQDPGDLPEVDPDPSGPISSDTPGGGEDSGAEIG